ncbi:MAG: hypothetical protein COB22_07485 [Cycloclasticus sp.]|nr:MAG: hypothetical protein COB22_07485 [Cycloclasticus sp.]
MQKVLSSAWFLLVLVVVIWSANWPIMKIGLRSIDPAWFTVARLLIAFIAISILLKVIGRFKLPHKQDLPVVFGAGTVLELTPWQILVALIIVVPMAWFGDTRPTIWSNELVVILLYNGVLATGLAQWASMRLTQLLPAVTVSLGFLLVPVAGVLLSTILLDEAFTVTLAIGMALIISGLLFQLNWQRFRSS